VSRQQTESGWVREKYPYETAPESVQVASAYEEGIIDGFSAGMIVCSGLVIIGYVLSWLL
jgi:hypothetical protein